MRALVLAVLVACEATDLASVASRATSCGPGTHVEGATCVLDRHELRIARKLAAAARRNRVLLVGTEPDGTPATGDVVFTVEPPAAGTFVHPQRHLGRLGADTFFVPCELGPNCPATATLVAAYAADPTVPIARAEIALVDPADVNPAAACLGGGTVVHLEGNDALLNGTRTIVNPTWTFAPIAYRSLLQARVTPQGGGTEWFLDFNTVRFGGDLVPGKRYEDVTKAYFSTSDQAPDHPAMDIRRSGFECTSVGGLFEVVDYRIDFSSGNPTTDVATFYFEQHCNGDPATVVTGCMHYEQ